MKVHGGLENLPKFENPVITFGSFDGIHNGHKVILERVVKTARDLGSESIVISFDPHPREVIYPKDHTLKLISTIEEKTEILEQIKVDHFVLIPFKIEFSQISPQEYIENVVIKVFNPRLIIIGYDHRFGLNRAGGYEMLKEYGETYGFEVEVIPEQKINDINISSTKIRNALSEGNIPLANRLLGYNFSFSGKVIQGKKIGRTIGFPTANLTLSHEKKLVPKNGIYAVNVILDGRDTYQGMLYIGNRSTVSAEDITGIEVNIFDFEEQIYGEELKIVFLKKIRDDEKFRNLKNLQLAITLDQQAVKSYFRLVSENEKKSIATVAILNYNGQEMMESYLPKVLYSSSYNVDFTIIDNDSSDDSQEYIREYHPEMNLIVLDKNYGFAEGYNKGIASIDSKYVILLNSDVSVTKNWLDPIIEKMEGDSELAACQPKILSLEEKSKFEYAGAAGGMMDKLGYVFCRGRLFDQIEEDEGQYDDEVEIFWASGAAMVIRTDIYKKFGGLDAKFFAHQEEIDLCWRLKNAGYKLMYVPQSIVYHLGGGTLDYSNPKKAFLNYRNNIRAIIKNEKNLATVLFQRIIFDLGSSFIFLLQGKMGLFLSIWKAYIFNLFSFLPILYQRKQIGKIVKRFKISQPNTIGRYGFYLPWHFFAKGRRKFTQINE